MRMHVGMSEMARSKMTTANETVSGANARRAGHDNGSGF